MKRTITMMLTFCLFAFSAFGQEWGWVGGLSERADTLMTGGHGVAVDPDGKIWYTSYYPAETVMVDTGTGTADDAQSVRAIYVFNPDGSEVAYSPITTITVAGEIDTMWNSSRGLRKDNIGNIVYASYWELYMLNYLNGEGMKTMLPADSASLTAPAFTSDGEMIVGYVAPSVGVDIYADDWSHLDKAIPADLASSYSRTIEVAKDGSAIYRAAYSSGYGFVRWNSSDGSIYGDFTGSSDTLAVGLQNESTAWQPGTGYLWGGSKGSLGWTGAAHYAFDPASDFALVDSIVIPDRTAAGALPRGIDFSPDGNTAYIVFYDFGEIPVYKFIKGATGTWEHTGTFISGYALNANYPNPFNPSTKLDVVMKDGGVADLRIYDMRGAEVAVLNSNYLSAGEHTFTFNAADFAAGVYIAKFTANGAMYTQTMTLVK